MDKIEVGEYVRINKSSRFLGIGKVKRIVGDTIYLKTYINLPMSFTFEEIKKYKHSKNIIDLIEKYEFANERLIIDIDRKNNKICLLEPFDDRNLSNSFVVWHDIKDIESIVTHEQFESVKYNFEEE